MGAWGSSAFDNDDAADWAWGLADDDGGGVVRQALEVQDLDYVELPNGAAAIAAAEIVAACLGHASTGDLPDEVAAWVSTHGTSFDHSDARTALDAVIRVAGDNSELRDLWAESGDDGWPTAIDDLRRRLGAASA